MDEAQKESGVLATRDKARQMVRRTRWDRRDYDLSVQNIRRLRQIVHR